MRETMAEAYRSWAEPKAIDALLERGGKFLQASASRL